MRSFCYGELFAGVSGLGLGFDSAGMVGKWRVEIDRAAAGITGTVEAWIARRLVTISGGVE